jgi:putative SOS response-associated peptidase YedK
VGSRCCSYLTAAPSPTTTKPAGNFKLEVVSVGTDECGKEITSVAVRFTDQEPKGGPSKIKPNSVAGMALEQFHELVIAGKGVEMDAKRENRKRKRRRRVLGDGIKALRGERELVMRSWGFILLRKGYAPKRVTNTRDDKLGSHFWKDSFAERRCLVPATAFCEPDEDTPARWHWFALKGERPLFAFAGIYRQWTGPIKKDGPNVDLEVFSFMTTLPNTLTSTINHERSPLLLTTEDEFATWLSGTAEEALGVIRTSDPDTMQIVQSGFDKKDLAVAA